MLWIDRLEKLGRLILWLVIAMVLAIVPYAYAKQRQAEAELKEALEKARGELVEMSKPKARRASRLSIHSIGGFQWGLNRSNATGHLLFTNASPRAGFVCVRGTATNPATQKSTESLAACQEVGAYASAVHLTFTFLESDLTRVCGSAPCSLEIEDVPLTEAETFGANASPPPSVFPGK